MDDAKTNIDTQYVNGQEFADKQYESMKENLETIEQRLADRIERDEDQSATNHEESNAVLKEMTEVQRETRANIGLTKKVIEGVESQSARQLDTGLSSQESSMTKIQNEAKKMDDGVIKIANKDLTGAAKDADKELNTIEKMAKDGSKEVEGEADMMEKDGVQETQDAARATMDATNAIGQEVRRVNKDIEKTEEVVDKTAEEGKENSRDAEENMKEETKAGMQAIKDAIDTSKEKYRELLAGQEKTKRDGLGEVRTDAKDAEATLQTDADKALQSAQSAGSAALRTSKQATDETVELAKAVVDVIKNMEVSGDMTKLTDAQEEKYRKFVASLVKREEIAAKDSAEGLFAEVKRQRAQMAGDLE